jgi:outer membrane protein with beta-barrel domain
VRVLPFITLVAASATLLTVPSAAHAQIEERRVTIEARGGLNVPTFDISDAVDAGPSFGIGAAVQLRPRVYLLGDVDLGFHSGVGLSGGATAPDVKVYHYMAKLGYQLLAERSSSPWSVIVNAGAGAMTFDVDGAGSNTYPAINVGAKIGYRLSPRVSLLLSPQGDIAFSKKDELGTTNAWVWPFTAGIRLGL